MGLQTLLHLHQVTLCCFSLFQTADTWASRAGYQSLPWICSLSSWARHAGLLDCAWHPLGSLDSTLARISSPCWGGQISTLRFWHCCCDHSAFLDKCTILPLPRPNREAWLPLQVQDSAGEELSRLTSQGVEGGQACAGQPNSSGNSIWDCFLLVVGLQVVHLRLPLHPPLTADNTHSHAGL